MLSVGRCGRCKFRLCVDTFEPILQSFLGGNASSFAVQRLDDWVFCFSVISKQVGLHIYNLKYYECEQFQVFFHLWGDGGLKFDREVERSEQEEESEWTVVRNRKNKQPSYADAVRQKEA